MTDSVNSIKYMNATTLDATQQKVVDWLASWTALTDPVQVLEIATALQQVSSDLHRLAVKLPA